MLITTLKIHFNNCLFESCIRLYFIYYIYIFVLPLKHNMVMSRDRNAGRGHCVKIDNSSVERVEEFKYLGTTLTNQNSIQEEIKSRLKLGNACYYSVQNLSSSRLLSKNLKIKI